MSAPRAESGLPPDSAMAFFPVAAPSAGSASFDAFLTPLRRRLRGGRGPARLARGEAAAKPVDERAKEAVARGAVLHTGGVFEGQISQPTILSNVPLDAALASEETFGPVVMVEVVDTAEEAVEAVNRPLGGAPDRTA